MFKPQFLNPMNKIHFCLPVFLAFVFAGCRQDELTEAPYNPAQENSGIELIILDSTASYLNPARTYAYFHINKAAIRDTTKIKNINVHRNGGHLFTLNPNQLTYFVDLGVSPGNTYEYTLFIRDVDLNLSKGTAPFFITVQ